MRPFLTPLFKAGLDTLHAVGVQRWLAPFTGGRGSILMLHQVRPSGGPGFAPNAHLEVTPDFLDLVISRVRASGADIVSMDEVAERLAAPPDDRRFVAFTLDDGYRDNLDHALPVFRRHACPFTLYVASDFAAHRGMLWWKVVEEAIRRSGRLRTMVAGVPGMIDIADPVDKDRAFGAICADLRRAGEPTRNRVVRDLAADAGFDAMSLCAQLCLGWDDLARVAAEPLATIGAHTRSHPILSMLGRDEARMEISAGLWEVESRICRKVDHFAYPFGDRAAAGPREFAMVKDQGFRTGVTTRRGVLHDWHTAQLECLPRVSLNGHFQAARYVDLYLSGAPFALANGFREVTAV